MVFKANGKFVLLTILLLKSILNQDSNTTVTNYKPKPKDNKNGNLDLGNLKDFLKNINMDDVSTILKDLNVTNNMDYAGLLKTLSNNDNLKNLDLSKLDNIKSIADLTKIPELKSLNLSSFSNLTDIKDIDSIKELIKTKAKNLNTTNLTNNTLPDLSNLNNITNLDSLKDLFGSIDLGKLAEPKNYNLSGNLSALDKMKYKLMLEFVKQTLYKKVEEQLDIIVAGLNKTYKENINSTSIDNINSNKIYEKIEKSLADLKLNKTTVNLNSMLDNLNEYVSINKDKLQNNKQISLIIKLIKKTAENIENLDTEEGLAYINKISELKDNKLLTDFLNTYLGNQNNSGNKDSSFNTNSSYNSYNSASSNVNISNIYSKNASSNSEDKTIIKNQDKNREIDSSISGIVLIIIVFAIVLIVAILTLVVWRINKSRINKNQVEYVAGPLDSSYMNY